MINKTWRKEKVIENSNGGCVMASADEIDALLKEAYIRGIKEGPRLENEWLNSQDDGTGFNEWLEKKI